MTSTLRKGALAVGFVAALALTTSVAQTAGAAAGSPPQAPMAKVDRSKAVQGSYIVVLDDGTRSTQTSQAADRAQAHGGKVERVCKALKGYSATLTAAQLTKVRQDPAVAYVEQDQTVSIDTTQTNATWALDRIDQRDLPLKAPTPTPRPVQALTRGSSTPAS